MRSAPELQTADCKGPQPSQSAVCEPACVAATTAIESQSSNRIGLRWASINRLNVHIKCPYELKYFLRLQRKHLQLLLKCFWHKCIHQLGAIVYFN